MIKHWLNSSATCADVVVISFLIACAVIIYAGTSIESNCKKWISEIKGNLQS